MVAVLMPEPYVSELDRNSLTGVTTMPHCAAATFMLLVCLIAPVWSATAQPAMATKVDAVFAEFDKPDSPGCVLGVIQGGQLAYTKGYGMADLERGVPLSPDGVFYMASVSKQFTAASIALLAQQGRISLDDDVRKYVPQLPDYGRLITIRHMIHHTSGLRDYLTLMSMADMPYGDEYEPEDIIELAARQEELNFDPGDEYLYSNTGYFLIPVIIERVTGQSIREYAEEHFFGPLGMRDTHFHDDHTHPVPNRVYSYGRSDDGGFELDFLEKFDQVGSGGLLTTVKDLPYWDRNFYDGQVGGRAFLDVLHTRGVLNEGDTLDYAFGLTISEYKGLPTVSHGGSMMGFRTQLMRFPEQRFTVACLCNLGSIIPAALSQQVADLYLMDQFQERLAEYAGEYYSRELDITRPIVVEDGNLIIETAGDSTITLGSRGRDTYRIPDGPEMKFVRDDRGRVTGLIAGGGRARGIRFVRASR
jgi:CubicO group peptidase (beta-lactamase class C family)